jgi:hypothetical protein
MKQQLFIILAGLALALSACSTQQNAQVVHARDLSNTPVSEGFFYFLPQTVVTVDLTVTRTEHTPGPFAEYAGRYLGLEDIVRDPSVYYEITEVNINSYAEPDPAQLYFVPFLALQNDPFYVSLSESGLIRSINAPFNQQEFMKGLSETQHYGVFGSDATFNHFIDLNIHERIDTIMERVRVDTMTVERQTLRRSWVEKSADIRAREVADHIVKIRDKKFDLISGFAEITYSKEAIEYMYQELNAMEERYLALFKGITASAAINYRYTITPEAASNGRPTTLFRFSTREGVLAANRQDGYPVSLELKSLGTTQGIPLMARPAPGARDQTSGFYYRIPEHATAVLMEGNITRAEARILVNQFGAVSRMAPQGMQLEFYPNTGSIKSIGALPPAESNQ